MASQSNSQSNSRNDSSNQSGRNDSQNDAQSASSRGTPGNEQAARSEEQLDREQKSLIGDTSEDRNLTGSTTYETLPDQGSDEGQSSRKASGSQGNSGESYGSSRGDTQR